MKDKIIEKFLQDNLLDGSVNVMILKHALSLFYDSLYPTDISDGEIFYRQVKNPDYEAYKNCPHINTSNFHDGAIICDDCTCIISQFGELIENPEPVGGHFEPEYYMEKISLSKLKPREVSVDELSNLIYENVEWSDDDPVPIIHADKSAEAIHQLIYGTKTEKLWERSRKQS